MSKNKNLVYTAQTNGNGPVFRDELKSGRSYLLPFTRVTMTAVFKLFHLHSFTSLETPDNHAGFSHSISSLFTIADIKTENVNTLTSLDI